MRGTIEETQLGHVMAHVVVRVAQQWRTCSYHSPEKLLTLSLGLGSLVKEAISTELLSLDRLKIENMLKKVQAIRSKGAIQGIALT
ncbi:MAG: hypothetical protein WBV31_11615 [Terriglobales bacterium]